VALYCPVTFLTLRGQRSRSKIKVKDAEMAKLFSTLQMFLSAHCKGWTVKIQVRTRKCRSNCRNFRVLTWALTVRALQWGDRGTVVFWPYLDTSLWTDLLKVSKDHNVPISGAGILAVPRIVDFFIEHYFCWPALRAWYAMVAVVGPSVRPSVCCPFHAVVSTMLTPIFGYSDFLYHWICYCLPHQMALTL